MCITFEDVRPFLQVLLSRWLEEHWARLSLDWVQVVGGGGGDDVLLLTAELQKAISVNYLKAMTTKIAFTEEALFKGPVMKPFRS